MVELTPKQQRVVATEGHQLITGGPGSGKTTVSILKAANLASGTLRAGQRVLFLSFARATVSRVLEAIGEEKDVSAIERSRIEVDTYHSFFWRVLKTHGYLVGLPRRLAILTPPGEAIALAGIRREYASDSKLDDATRSEKVSREKAERHRLATEEGKVCFDLFADLVAELLEGSAKLREVTAIAYPCIILDEFQDTSAAQWRVVKALGNRCTLIALADPEQRIFEFIGADPERLEHFKLAFEPTLTELGSDNHRSKGTDILLFGNDVLLARFSKSEYAGISFYGFPSNKNQAHAALVGQILKARARMIATDRRDWSLAILVPTKRMTRLVADVLREPFGSVPPIAHTASIDMEGPILAADVIAHLLQQNGDADDLGQIIHLMCQYYRGRGGSDPGKGDLAEANRLEAALAKWKQRIVSAQPQHANSIIHAVNSVLTASRQVNMSGDPDKDWVAIRAALLNGPCSRLREVANDARNIRLLERGKLLRNTLQQNWRDRGRYADALNITRLAFVQEYFATAQRPETGVVVMNMHKAKGKQFDEVIIFEGWPMRVGKEVKANPDRIVRENKAEGDLSQARQNFRVSVTRARTRTTIMTPADDVCVLLPCLNDAHSNQRASADGEALLLGAVALQSVGNTGMHLARRNLGPKGGLEASATFARSTAWPGNQIAFCATRHSTGLRSHGTHWCRRRGDTRRSSKLTLPASRRGGVAVVRGWPRCNREEIAMTRRSRKADTTPAIDTSSASESEAISAVVYGSPLPPRPGSKLGIVLGLLQAAEGVSLAKLAAVTDWQPHTTRAALTGLRKRGYVISHENVGAADGAKCSVYRITAGQAQ